ncbi:unnamed protein product [Oikopleura dioica]|uniref:Uncharacterized protein n=1 Tax=Oikopleura dioica TaxID=34765 RepID=E4Y729_OIKDI|nr:unnamed protein product [Oikopleura dioica]
MELCQEFLELLNKVDQLHDYSGMDPDIENERFRDCFNMDECDLNIVFEGLRWMNIDNADFRLVSFN